VKKDFPYRKDVEGLRAVAVIPVVLYHVGISFVPGGFVGVDIFFVISGFLITQLLRTDMDAGQFTFAGFYERRIRRIVPALLATLTATFILGWHYCLPDELADLCKSLVAAALSASNFYFWTTSGYFAGAAGTKPLLHTWSLAVEEQFYVLWPVFLVAGRRYFRERLVLTVTLIAVLSFVVSAIGAFRFPDAAFYLPYSRMWELAVGALLALSAAPPICSGAARNGLGALGLVLIVGSVLLIRPTMPFPGLLALPPCAGAALIILAGRDGGSATASALSLRPLTFVGAISYSLYLWHWPITVFQTNYTFLFEGLSHGATKILIIAVSMVIAVLSWKFVEQPFRVGSFRPSAPALAKMAIASTVVLVVGGSTVSARDGLPSRFTPDELDTVAHLNRVSRATWRADRCFLFDARADFKLAPECLQLEAGKKNYLLFGDSHAAELWKGFSGVFPEVHFLQASASGCFPTLSHSPTESQKCVAVMDGVLKGFLPTAHVDNVLLAARWKPSMFDDLERTLTWLKDNNIRVTLIGPTVRYDSPVPRLVIDAMRASDPARIWRHRDESINALDATMRSMALAHGVEYISLIRLECSQFPCPDNLGNPWPEMFDDEHFNEQGSTIIARQVRRAYGTFGS
jgi:peptidoglycan/LPS O-acetylase OafA/YrhL